VLCLLGRVAVVVLIGVLGGVPLPSSASPGEQTPDVPADIPSVTKADTIEHLQTGPVFLDRVVDAAEYMVGPGDGLRINIVGEAPTTFDVTVTPEATVVLPTIGVESVRGKTLVQVRDDLTRTLKGFYPKSGVTVSLVEVRRFRVTVSGAVQRPGLHVVTAGTRASEVLAAAVMNDRAASRSIPLLRGGETLLVDLIAFERLGRRAANPYLTEGDVITVPEKDSRWGRVEVAGAVNGPGRFDFVEGERITDLLDLAYGLAPNADTTVLELWRFHPGESVARRFDWPIGSRFGEWRMTQLMPDDRLIVRGVESYHQKLSVQVEGEVQRPGTYVFSKSGILLHEVIDSAGGFTPDADLERASIVRAGLPDWLMEHEKRIERLPADLWSRSEIDWMSASALSSPGRVATDFVRLFQKGERQYEYDVLLLDGDRVVVPQRVPFVNVIGRVVQPGLVSHLQGGDIAYYLQRVGGYAWRADRGGTFLVKAGTGTALKKDQIHTIESGDMIVVPTQRGKRFWNSLKETLIVASNVATIYLVIRQATE
jgi:protein involved in polysaccharide export with SLBB domain